MYTFVIVYIYYLLFYVFMTVIVYYTELSENNINYNIVIIVSVVVLFKDLK